MPKATGGGPPDDEDPTADKTRIRVPPAFREPQAIRQMREFAQSPAVKQAIDQLHLAERAMAGFNWPSTYHLVVPPIVPERMSTSMQVHHVQPVLDAWVRATVDTSGWKGLAQQLQQLQRSLLPQDLIDALGGGLSDQLADIFSTLASIPLVPGATDDAPPPIPEQIREAAQELGLTEAETRNLLPWVLYILVTLAVASVIAGGVLNPALLPLIDHVGTWLGVWVGGIALVQMNTGKE